MNTDSGWGYLHRLYYIVKTTRYVDKFLFLLLKNIRTIVWSGLNFDIQDICDKQANLLFKEYNYNTFRYLGFKTFNFNSTFNKVLYLQIEPYTNRG